MQINHNKKICSSTPLNNGSGSFRSFAERQIPKNVRFFAR
jgi:adenosylcobinamide amidohydrolase